MVSGLKRVGLRVDERALACYHTFTSFMADPETSSQAALVRGEDDERQDSSVQSWRGWTGKKLHSHGFQSTIFTLVCHNFDSLVPHLIQF